MLRISIPSKLVILNAIAGMFLIGVTSFVGYQYQQKTLYDNAVTLLTSIRNSKKSQVERYFELLKEELLSMAQNPTVIQASQEFIKAWHMVESELKPTATELAEYKKQVAEYYKNEFLKRLNANVIQERPLGLYLPANDTKLLLHYLYIANNPNPTGAKYNLEAASDASTFSKIHKKYHWLFRDFVKRFAFYDFFIVEPSTGIVVYTDMKEVDFSSNFLKDMLHQGPIAGETNIARLYKKTVTAGTSGVEFIDFEPYDPSYGDSASFLAAPVFDQGRMVAIIMVQVPMDTINKIMMDDRNWVDGGLQQTGESYLVARDFKMRSLARMFAQEPQRFLSILEKRGVEKRYIDEIRIYQTTVAFQKVETDQVKDALRGDSGVMESENYLGEKVLAAYAPLAVYDTTWGIIVEQQLQELYAPLWNIWKVLLNVTGWVFLIFMLFVLVSIRVIYSTLRPLRPIVDFVSHAAQATPLNLAQSTGISGADDLGVLGVEIDQLMLRLRTSIKTMEQQHEQLQASEQKVIDDNQNIHGYSQDMHDKTARAKTATGEMRQVIDKFRDLKIQSGIVLSSIHAKLDVLSAQLSKQEDQKSLAADIVEMIGNFKLLYENQALLEKTINSADTAITGIKEQVDALLLTYEAIYDEAERMNQALEKLREITANMGKELDTFIK